MYVPTQETSMAGKRGNNEGTIQKRADGRWQAIISLGDGKRKYFYGKTRSEVARRLSEALRDRDKGLEIVSERQTVAQFLETWLKIVKPSIKQSTWERYED